MQELALPLPDVRLHYLRTSPSSPAADQPTLVFLHYFGGSSRTWLPVIAQLEKDFPCVALDLRGSGDSHVDPATADTTLAYSPDAMAGDLPALVAELGCFRYILVGHSMGGKVALAAATAHGCAPGLQSLILLAPSPPTPEPMSDSERARLLAGCGQEAAARKTLREITAHPLPPDEFSTALSDQLRVAPAMWRAWLEYGNRQDISARLPRLQVPVFLATGDQDANITPKLLRQSIADQLPPSCPTIPKRFRLLPTSSRSTPPPRPPTSSVARLFPSNSRLPAKVLCEAV